MNHPLAQLGLVGRKIGMTRVFTDAGESRPVTVIAAAPNRIVRVKTAASDGYDAVQVTVGACKENRVNKPTAGHYAKAGTEPGRGMWEFRLSAPIDWDGLGEAGGDADVAAANETADDAASAKDDAAAAAAKDESSAQKPQTAREVTLRIFEEGQKVDVTGRTIGKGFSGVIKRHGYRGGRATHGNSKAHRKGGAIGNAQDPGRVFKGKKMAGQMGRRRRVQQGLEVVRVDVARELLLIGGSIPGARGGDVIIRPSHKLLGRERRAAGGAK